MTVLFELFLIYVTVLTEEACELIGEEYSKIRSHDFENSDLARTQPVTARALETLIRLSTAHAKARLSKSIDREDAETAIELVQVINIFNTVGPRYSRGLRSQNISRITRDLCFGIFLSIMPFKRAKSADN